jgi:hypothetical protein
MDEFETTYFIRAEDQASALIRQYSEAWEELDNSVKENLTSVNQQTERHGKELNKLTQFYREQRSEHRLHSFLFRESRDAIGAAALALSGFSMSMGKGSEEMKRFSTSMQEGFITFQGVEFALSALGAGPWAMVIGGLAGITAAFTSFNAEANKAADEGVKKFLDQMAGFSGWDSRNAKRGVAQELDDINKAIDRNRTLVASAVTGRGAGMTTTVIRDQELEATLQRRKTIAQAFQADIDARIEKEDTWNRIVEYGNKVFDERTKGILEQLDAQQTSRKAVLSTLTDESEILALQKQIDAVDEYRNSLLGKQTQVVEKNLDLISATKKMVDAIKPVEFIDKEQERRFKEFVHLLEVLNQSPETRRGLVDDQRRAALSGKDSFGQEALKPKKVNESDLHAEQVKFNQMEQLWVNFEAQVGTIEEILINNFGSSVDAMVQSMYEGTLTMGEFFEKMALKIMEEITAMTIKMAIFKAIAGIFSGGASEFASEAGGTIMADSGPMFTTGINRQPIEIAAPERATVPRDLSSLAVDKQGSIVNNFTINAMDSRGVAEWLKSEDARRAFSRAIRDAQRKGKS